MSDCVDTTKNAVESASSNAAPRSVFVYPSGTKLGSAHHPVLVGR
jgi:hypothetical protein